MRISLLADETLYPLAGQDGVSERVHSSAADLRINGETEMQISARVRATYGKPIDRGNLIQTITFSTWRQFATADEAERFAEDYDSDFARSGSLIMESISPSGDVSVRSMENAVVSPPERRLTGCSLTLAYTVTGGEITTLPEFPDPAVLWNEDEDNWEA